jgi:transposase-like protein
MVDSKIPTLQWLRNKIEQLDSDLLWDIVKSVAKLLMSHVADMHCNAPYSQKAAERTNHRNGYQQRRWDTAGRQHRT